MGDGAVNESERASERERERPREMMKTLIHCLYCFVQLKSFHNELLTELEKKVELDARYLNVSLVIVCLKPIFICLRLNAI